MVSIIKMNMATVSPEGAIHDSPGQRPGFAVVQSIQAL